MSKNSVKKATITAALICAAIVPGISNAHDTTGVLGSAISNIDVYHTSCFTWTTAAAAALAKPESALPTQRFVARVAKKCANPNAACGAQTGTLRVTAAPEDSTANDGATLRGATATATAANGGAALGETPTWVATPSAWVQTANAGITDKNGEYIIAVGHETAVANNYWVQFHCEYPAVNASPAPSGTNGLIHTGTGILGTGETPITSPFNGPTDGDWNMIINQ